MFTIASFGLLFLALIASYVYGGESNTTFDGSTYVTYSYSGEPRTFPDDIIVVFKTIKPSGMLFHATSSGGDFITLELLRGKIRYVSLLGCCVLSQFTSLSVLSVKWDVDYYSFYFKSKGKICQLSLESVQWGTMTYVCHGRTSVFIEPRLFLKKEAALPQKPLLYLFIGKRLHFMQVIIIGNIWSNLCKLTLRNCKKENKIILIKKNKIFS